MNIRKPAFAFLILSMLLAAMMAWSQGTGGGGGTNPVYDEGNAVAANATNRLTTIEGKTNTWNTAGTVAADATNRLVTVEGSTGSWNTVTLSITNAVGTSTGTSLVKQVTGRVATLKDLAGSATVTLSDNGDTVTFSASGGGSSGITVGTNEVLVLNGFAAYGSTATSRVRFSTTVSNTLASAIASYATNAANASTITILRGGNYSVNANGQTAAGSAVQVALALNADGTEGPTTIGSAADGKCLGYNGTAGVASDNSSPHVSWTGWLPSNSVVAFHMSGTPGAGGYVNLRFNLNFY